MRNSHYTIVTTLAVLLGAPLSTSAQGVFFGAGVGAASVPRSVAPLCASARRLTGPSLSAQAGLHAKGLRFATGLDYTARPYNDAADCVPNVGIHTDSVFAPANNSVITAAGEVSFMPMNQLGLSVGAGWVPDHRSWFVSGGIGIQYRKLRGEITARRHRTSFDEVTRDFTAQGVREISRSSHTEGSWGGLIRLLLVTR